MARGHPEKPITGQRYGRLVAIEVAGIAPNSRDRIWRCRCDCGNEHLVRRGNLRNGTIKSCGCLLRETRGSSRRTHGMSRKERTYSIWKAMKKRCGNSNMPKWHRYGGRGITVCERWKTSFENFLADMGHAPPSLSIDRINNDGNYEPGNCRWADAKTQAANRPPRKAPAPVPALAHEEAAA